MLFLECLVLFEPASECMEVRHPYVMVTVVAEKAATTQAVVDVDDLITSDTGTRFFEWLDRRLEEIRSG